MHFLNGIFKVIDINLKNVELELLAFLNEVLLNDLILPDMLTDIGFDVPRKMLYRLIL